MVNGNPATSERSNLRAPTHTTFLARERARSTADMCTGCTNMASVVSGPFTGISAHSGNSRSNSLEPAQLIDSTMLFDKLACPETSMAGFTIVHPIVSLQEKAGEMTIIATRSANLRIGF